MKLEILLNYYISKYPEIGKKIYPEENKEAKLAEFLWFFKEEIIALQKNFKAKLIGNE